MGLSSALWKLSQTIVRVIFACSGNYFFRKEERDCMYKLTRTIYRVMRSGKSRFGLIQPDSEDSLKATKSAPE